MTLVTVKNATSILNDAIVLLQEAQQEELLDYTTLIQAIIPAEQSKGIIEALLSRLDVKEANFPIHLMALVKK